MQNLQLSGVDLCPSQEARSWVLTVVPDGPVLGAVEVGVLGRQSDRVKIRRMASQNKRKVGLSFTNLLFCGMNFKNIISNLEILAEGWHHRHVKVVGLVVWGGLGEGPELVLVVLRTDQGGDHGQGSLEGSVGPGVD